MPMNPGMALATEPMPETPGETPQSMEQSLGQGAPQNYISQEGLSDEREQAYESAFRDQAYGVFTAKHPELTPAVVTFKVIKSSIDDGDAVGAFILSHQGETLYVPVVMTENALKPMEIIYSKRMDKFLPFNRDWLQVVLSATRIAMGEGAKTPDLMSSDVDITSMIRPPIDGRNVYAMDLSEIDHLEILKDAGNDSKKQYADMLKSDKALLKFASENFDLEEIKRALTPKVLEKTAVETVKLETLDLSDPSAKIKKVFGAKSKEAVKTMAKDGFAFKDDRVDLNSAYALDTKLVLEEPSQSGIYTVYQSDGTTRYAMVIVEPDKLEDHDSMYGPAMVVGKTYTEHQKPRNFLVVYEDGDFFRTHHLIASPAPNSDFKGAVADQVFGRKKPGAVTKSNIMFVKTEENIVSATEPRYVDATQSTPGGGKKYIKYDSFKGINDHIWREKKKPQDVDYELVHTKTHTGKMVKPKCANTVIIPDTYLVVKLGDAISDRHHLTTPRQVLQFVQQKMSSHGSETVKLASLGAGEYAINGRAAGDLRETATKLAEDYQVNMATCVKALRELELPGDSTKILVVPHEKRASIFGGSSDGTQMPPEMIQQMGQQEAMQQAGMGQQQTPDMGMLQAGMQTQDPELYSLGVVNSLAQNPDIKELLAVHSPTLEKAMDSSGRMLLTFWIRGNKTKQSLGEETYYSTEEALRTVFKGIGSLLIKINRQSAAMPDEAGM